MSWITRGAIQQAAAEEAAAAAESVLYVSFATDFSDVLGRHTVTVHNGPEITAATPNPIQTNSGSFNGTSQYLSVPNSVDFAFGSGDFTVEWYVYAGTTATDYLGGVWGATEVAWTFIFDSDGANQFYYSEDGTNGVQAAVYTHGGTNTFRWIHVGFSRVGNTGYLFYDGAIRATADMTGVTIHTPTVPLRIASAENFAEFGGNMANFLITKNEGKYSGAVNDTVTPVYP